MAIQKNITIDGIDVPFKASAAVPRLYRLKFRRDIYQTCSTAKVCGRKYREILRTGY